MTQNKEILEPIFKTIRDNFDGLEVVTQQISKDLLASDDYGDIFKKILKLTPSKETTHGTISLFGIATDSIKGLWDFNKLFNQGTKQTGFELVSTRYPPGTVHYDSKMDKYFSRIEQYKTSTGTMTSIPQSGLHRILDAALAYQTCELNQDTRTGRIELESRYTEFKTVCAEYGWREESTVD